MADLTLFEKIHQGAIPAKFLHRDDLCFAIEDIEPKAPFHALIIPVKPIPSLAAVEPGDAAIVAACVQAARAIAREKGLETGWRLVTNVGSDAGQTVAHLHFHLLGGRKLGWPPG
jgi:histidine triad (HIT) family protein